MTFERRFLLLVTGLLVLAVAATMTALAWGSRGGLDARVRAEAERTAVRLANAAALARDLPAAAEAAVAQQMLAQAALTAQLVSLGDAAKAPPKAISDRLRAVVGETAVTDITVTDSRGKPAMHTAPAGEAATPAPLFQGLLNRTPPEVVQPAARREDGKTVKSVGVAGIDRPRIIQVTADVTRLAEVTKRLGLDHAVADALADGATAAWVLAPTGAVLARAGDAAGEPAAAEQEAVKAAASARRAQLVTTGGTLAVAAPVEGGGAALVRMPAPGGMLPLWPGLLAGLLVVAAGGALVWRALAREVEALARLTAATTALAAGRFNPFTLDPLRERPDEVGRLAQAFRNMAGAIDAREQGLEAALHLREAKLEESAEKLKAVPAVAEP